MTAEKFADDIIKSIKEVMEVEREACIAIIKEYLQFNDQRAVSWHEIQACIQKIRERGE